MAKADKSERLIKRLLCAKSPVLITFAAPAFHHCFCCFHHVPPSSPRREVPRQQTPARLAFGFHGSACFVWLFCPKPVSSEKNVERSVDSTWCFYGYEFMDDAWLEEAGFPGISVPEAIGPLVLLTLQE